jgi:hypothetical protein
MIQFQRARSDEFLTYISLRQTSLHHGTTQECASVDKLHDMVELLTKTQQYIYDKSSTKASMYGSCISSDPHCATHALNGQCQANPTWMEQKCPAVCQLCK